MNWITPDIAIGSYHEALDVDLLRREGVRSILGLTTALRGKNPIELHVERVEIITLLDGPGNELSRFSRAISLLEELVVQSAPILVHCRAGWSRSPAVVAGYLVRSKSMSAEEALAELASKRTCSMVPEMRTLVSQYAAQIRG